MRWHRSFGALLISVGLALAGFAVLAGPAQSVDVSPDIREIPLETGDVAFDPVSGMIYASASSSAGELANSIVAIDPNTGAIGASVVVGEDPERIAISDDGQYLYVALAGPRTVRRVHLPTMTAGIEFSVGAEPDEPGDPDGPPIPGEALAADDLAVLPGIAESVAVVSSTNRFNGVLAVYDDGVRRGDAAEADNVVIEFSDSPTRLYGFTNGTSDPRLLRWTIDSSGVSVRPGTLSLPGGRSRGDIEFQSGLVYTTSGQVVDPEALEIVGSYFNIDFALFRGLILVEPDAAARRTHFLSHSAIPGLDSFTLTSYDQDTLERVTASRLAGTAGVPSSLVRVGEQRFAFRSDVGKVFLVELPIMIDIDIQPRDETNTVGENGRLEVAALSISPFDATRIDFDTVTFGPGSAHPARVSWRDVDKDGNRDAVFTFLDGADLPFGEVEACLTGETAEGDAFVGCNFVTRKEPRQTGPPEGVPPSSTPVGPPASPPVGPPSSPPVGPPDGRPPGGQGGPNAAVGVADLVVPLLASPVGAASGSAAVALLLLAGTGRVYRRLRDDLGSPPSG